MSDTKKIVLQNIHRIRLMDVLPQMSGDFYQKCLIREILQAVTYTTAEAEEAGIKTERIDDKVSYTWEKDTPKELELTAKQRTNLVKLLENLQPDKVDGVVIDIASRLVEDWNELEQILGTSGDGDREGLNGNSN